MSLGNAVGLLHHLSLQWLYFAVTLEKKNILTIYWIIMDNSKLLIFIKLVCDYYIDAKNAN